MEEILSSVYFLFFRVVSIPVLYVHCENVAGSLNVIDEQPNDEKFVFRFDTVGVELVHFYNRLNHFLATHDLNLLLR